MPSQAKQFIKVFEAETFQALSSLEQSQHPFAFAKALTYIAGMAAAAVRDKTRDEFDLKTEFIPRGVRRLPAKKSELKSTGKTTAAVFTMDKMGFMTIHEEGGEREPFASGGRDKGKTFALPGVDMGEKMLTRTGRTKKRFTPKELLENYRPSKEGKPRGKASRRRAPFIIRARGSGVPMIVRRQSTTRYPLEVMYIFTTRASYKPVWDFEETVTAVVEKHFPAVYQQNLEHAVRTAR